MDGPKWCVGTANHSLEPLLGFLHLGTEHFTKVILTLAALAEVLGGLLMLRPSGACGVGTHQCPEHSYGLHSEPATAGEP